MPREAALLARIGARLGEPATAARLAVLQRAWCFAQPFHNLDLLAGAATGASPLNRAEAVERCAAGLGGPCHVQSWGFLSLLQAAGFNASLCGATVTRPDDHLLVRVAIEGSMFLCDVGNGQPYLKPFPVDRHFAQSHLGWDVQSGPVGNEIVLQRRSPDQPAWRTVYRARPELRGWTDFEEVIDRHHREPGFGPFLAGLRVVRIGPSAMTVVRDDTVTVYGDDGFERRKFSDAELVQLVADDLGLASLPVAAAVASWRTLARGTRDEV